jgi:hypothetical protein
VLTGEMREDLANNTLKAHEFDVEKFFEETGFRIEKGSEEYWKLCRERLKKLIEAFEIDAERARGNYNNRYDRMRSEDTVQAVPTSPEVVNRGKTLSELIKLYLASKKPTWKPETYAEYERTFNMLLEYLKDVDVAAIRHEDFERFRDLLMVLPSVPV